MPLRRRADCTAIRKTTPVVSDDVTAHRVRCRESADWVLLADFSISLPSSCVRVLPKKEPVRIRQERTNEAPEGCVCGGSSFHRGGSGFRANAAAGGIGGN